MTRIIIESDVPVFVLAIPMPARKTVRPSHRPAPPAAGEPISEAFPSSRSNVRVAPIVTPFRKSA
jgi:hypothetical protein